MFGFLTGNYSASAKVADGRLVISLPDAETPAVWILDLAEASTCVLRIESDRQGLYVIKKHGAKGAAETVAVYRDRDAAQNALHRATRALEKARNNRGDRPSRFMRILFWMLTIWFLLYVLNIGRLMVAMVANAFLASPQQTSAQVQGSSQQAAPPADSAGVPVSADDFLKNNQGTQNILLP
jgi:hypothetical protein